MKAAQIKNRRYPVSKLYNAYNTLPILHMYEQQLLLFVQKFVHHCESLPGVVCDYFIFNNSVYGYNTWSSDKLHMISTKTSFGRRSAKYHSCLLWNNLPHELQQPISTSVFEIKIKRYLKGYK